MKMRIRKLWRKILEFFGDHGLEHYLAGSVDIYDIERRQQAWMRMGDSERNFWGSH